MSDMRVETYESKNAPEHRRWIAFIEHSGVHLPVWFKGKTENEAIQGASDVWEENRKVREDNIRRREEGRTKAAEARKKKESA